MSEMQGELQLTLLGKVDINRDGVPIAGFSTNKDRALLIYLAVTGRPHSRPALAGLLWGNMPEANARANLRRSLSTLRRLLGAHLDIDRQMVAFDRDVPYWLDVEEFEGHALSGDDIGRLREAVQLYAGDFLEGFFLRGAPAFEEWAVAYGARLRELALQSLHTLSVHYAGLGEAGLQEGIDYTTRLLALEPWREEAHRGLMQLLAQSGQRGAALAQYETCRQILAEELGVEPGPETRELYERIRDGEVRGESPARRAPPRGREPTLTLPGFLRDDAQVEVKRHPFVARERELARLAEFLDQALAGQGMVAFVTGGPGRGKTALMTEFARRALDEYPDILLGAGSCNAYSGVGDPYLPFREALAVLTGDVEALWAAGIISRVHAQRLWRALPLSVQALLDHGPDLLDALVSRTDLLLRAEAAATDGATWLARLQEKVDRRRGRSEDFEQSFLFQQAANVLRALSGQRPVLLLLDDLQWIDAASAGLLFHLGRRLAGARVLIVGTYRPEEVISGHPELVEGRFERHPLQKALGEFKRQYGDVWLDLGQVDATASHAFVDALLATQPHRLRTDFRDALAERTGGHPLFTIELLRAMQERGDLTQDAEGTWVQRRELDWERLPARVEAVIEERVGRLGGRLREVLSVASVEGAEFTAQVVAHVLREDERELLRILAQELEGRHRLVREAGTLILDHQRLARYRFSHDLFQTYVYRDLSEGERALLHGEVGKALEALYKDRSEEIAVQLAHHFAGAGNVQRERRYAKIAGKRAAAAYANEEVVRYLSRALELTPETEETRAERYDLLLARAAVWELQDDPRLLADLEALQELAEGFKDERLAAAKQAEVAGRRSKYAELTGDFPSAIASAQEAVRLARTAGDYHTEAEGLWQWGLMRHKQGEYGRARPILEQALIQAQEVGYHMIEMACLRGLSMVCRVENDLQRAQVYAQQAVSVAREIDDRFHIAYGLWHLGEVHGSMADYAKAEACYRDALIILHEIGDRRSDPEVLCSRGWNSILKMDLAGANRYLDGALANFREIGYEHRALEPLAGLARVALTEGDSAQALTYVEKILDYLENHELVGTDEPFRIYLACYRVLRANDDPRGEQLLSTAYDLLQQRAANIDSEDLRRSFLENVPIHRELTNEWRSANRSV